MKALIIGVEGFVGGYLAEYLLEKDIKVWGTVLDSTNCKDLNTNIIIRALDITNKEQILSVLKEFAPDYIFHLAAQSSAAISWQKPNLTVNVNTNGTVNLLECIKELEFDTRVLLIGSSEEYGFVNEDEIPVSEIQPLRPGNPYSVSKVAQTLMGQVYARAYDLDIIMVRAFNHIGPKQSSIFVVSDFAKRIAEIEKGIKEPILYVGNLEAQRDFTDVRDVIQAYYELILNGDKGEIYNVGSGKAYKIQFILEKLLSLTDKNIEVRTDPAKMRPSDVPIIQCDNTKIKAKTNWSPRHTLEDTLADVLNYWREHV